ncbi:MAG: hypothetical protein QM500_15225 [Methylococcales bacterium]
MNDIYSFKALNLNENINEYELNPNTPLDNTFFTKLTLNPEFQDDIKAYVEKYYFHLIPYEEYLSLVLSGDITNDDTNYDGLTPNECILKILDNDNEQSYKIEITNDDLTLYKKLDFELSIIIEFYESIRNEDIIKEGEVIAHIIIYNLMYRRFKDHATLYYKNDINNDVYIYNRLVKYLHFTKPHLFI